MPSERLNHWMNEQSLSIGDLATRTGFSYDYIYKITTGERVVSEAFKWRFASAFGYATAIELFTQQAQQAAA